MSQRWKNNLQNLFSVNGVTSNTPEKCNFSISLWGTVSYKESPLVELLMSTELKNLSSRHQKSFENENISLNSTMTVYSKSKWYVPTPFLTNYGIMQAKS